MSKSLGRVRAALAAAGIAPRIVRFDAATRTAAEAAEAAGCEIDQIVKSIILAGAQSGRPILFLTPGGHRVDAARAAALAGEALGKADAAMVRRQTGFAIGGVAPFGHLAPIRAFMDPRLFDFDTIWAAAGTPHHIVELAPATIRDLSGAGVAAFTASG